jgi:UrcA family protein
MTLIKSASVLLATSLAALFIPTAAFAQNDETVVKGARYGDQPVAYVQYRDINLGSAEGQRKLQARVRYAANNICIQNGITDLETRMSGLRCRDAAIANAAPQIARVVERFRDRDFAALEPIAITANN